MENKIMMPASYNVLSCEEMTYTEGGATFTEALLNWIPPIGWYMGVTAMRNYRKSHPNDWLDTGLDALSRDMDSSAQNVIWDASSGSPRPALPALVFWSMLPSSCSDPAHKIRPERPKTPLPAAFSAIEGRGLFIKQK